MVIGLTCSIPSLQEQLDLPLEDSEKLIFGKICCSLSTVIDHKKVSCHTSHDKYSLQAIITIVKIHIAKLFTLRCFFLFFKFMLINLVHILTIYLNEYYFSLNVKKLFWDVFMCIIFLMHVHTLAFLQIPMQIYSLQACFLNTWFEYICVNIT